MFNPVNLLLTLVGAGASRPAGGLPRPAYPPPTFRGLAYPDDGRIAVVVWAAPSDVGEPVLTPIGRAVREGGRLKTRVLLREPQPRRSPYAQMPRQRRPKELVMDALGVPVQVYGKQVPLKFDSAPIQRNKMICPLDK